MTLTAAQLDALDPSIPRVTVEQSGQQWTWTDPCGVRRFRAVGWRVPNLHHEAHDELHRERLDRECSGDRLVVLIPPSE